MNRNNVVVAEVFKSLIIILEKLCDGHPGIIGPTIKLFFVFGQNAVCLFSDRVESGVELLGELLCCILLYKLYCWLEDGNDQVFDLGW